MNNFLSGKCFLIGVIWGIVFSGCASEMGRGSGHSLYTFSDPLEVQSEDEGKDLQLRLDQKLLFKLKNGGESSGQWELVDYDKRTLLLLSDSPRVGTGFQGFLLQARALGHGNVSLHFDPTDENNSSRDLRFEVSIRR